RRATSRARPLGVRGRTRRDSAMTRWSIGALPSARCEPWRSSAGSTPPTGRRSPPCSPPPRGPAVAGRLRVRQGTGTAAAGGTGVRGAGREGRAGGGGTGGRIRGNPVVEGGGGRRPPPPRQVRIDRRRSLAGGVRRRAQRRWRSGALVGVRARHRTRRAGGAV